MTVTDDNTATNDAPPNTINTAPHSPNVKMSVWQLLDGQEYPVAKGDSIKKGFDREAAVERFVAYLHGL